MFFFIIIIIEFLSKIPFKAMQTEWGDMSMFGLLF